MSAKSALAWMRNQRSPNANVLFRGQNRVWPSIAPSISRLQGPAKIAMWALCRRFHTVASGVTGFSIPNERDRLAILQHYVGRSPVIDLTGTPEVALYFALLGAAENDTCVVYSIDRSKAASATVEFSDHEFLALPLNGGGVKHRWLRQDGYSVGPTNWRDPDAVDQFDLRKLAGVDHMTFQKTKGDEDLVRDLGDLEDTEDDLLAVAVRGVSTALARHLGLMQHGIAQILEQSKSKDGDARLISEINDLMMLATSAGAPAELVNTLQNMRSILLEWPERWDSGWACALQVTRGQIDNCISKKPPCP